MGLYLTILLFVEQEKVGCSLSTMLNTLPKIIIQWLLYSTRPGNNQDIGPQLLYFLSFLYHSRTSNMRGAYLPDFRSSCSDKTDGLLS